MAELTDEAIEAHLKHGPKVPVVSSTMHVYPINGACHRVAPDARSSCSQRCSHHVTEGCCERFQSQPPEPVPEPRFRHPSKHLRQQRERRARRELSCGAVAQDRAAVRGLPEPCRQRHRKDAGATRRGALPGEHDFEGTPDEPGTKGG